MNNLVQILSDTIDWASDPANVHTDDMYSKWDTHRALMDDLKAYHSDALQGRPNFNTLQMLFAPTAYLCEIVTERGTPTYLALASRFDEWLASYNPKGSA